MQTRSMQCPHGVPTLGVLPSLSAVVVVYDLCECILVRLSDS